jgi:hypothetical protein
MSYFWFSFSKNGKNQGVINIEAETSEHARDKAIKLGIVPGYDHVESIEIDEPELILDTLITPDQMTSMNYDSIKYKTNG